MSYARRPPMPFYIYQEGSGAGDYVFNGEDVYARVPFDAMALLIASINDRHNDELTALIERGRVIRNAA